MVSCMDLGLNGVKFFPAVTSWDEQRHQKAHWNKRDWVEVYNATEAPSNAAGLCRNRKEGYVLFEQSSTLQEEWDAMDGECTATSSKDHGQRNEIEYPYPSELRRDDTEWRLCIICALESSDKR